MSLLILAATIVTAGLQLLVLRGLRGRVELLELLKKVQSEQTTLGHDWILLTDAFRSHVEEGRATAHPLAASRTGLRQ